VTAAHSVSTHQLRRRWAGIGAVLVVSVLTAGLLAIVSFRMKKHEAVLDQRGRETSAVVTASTYRPKQRDQAEVRYEAEGRTYEARLPVSDSDDFLVGDEIQIIYDPANPGHARPTEGWSPAFEEVLIYAAVVLGFGLLHSARRIVRTVLLLRTARRPSQTTTMIVESFSVTRWWQRWPRQWAAIWPLGADPLIDDVQVYVPIEELSPRAAIHIHQETLVLGTPEPQRLLVIIHGESVVWPRGRATRSEPGGSISA
jgi:hypothetical protein